MDGGDVGLQKGKMKSNKKWIWITISITVVVTVVAAAIGYNYWSAQQREEKANETVKAFVKALENEDYQKLSELVSPASLKKVDYTAGEVQERYETIYGGVGADVTKAEDVQVIENEESGHFSFHYNLHMTTSLGEISVQSFEADLEETAEDFAVDWQPNLIFPQMESGDTVSINMQSGERGDILDRNGDLLAGEGPAWQAGLYPTALGEGQKREETLQVIAETFEISLEALENLLSAGWVTEESFVPFTIVKDGETPEVSGVLYQETSARTYPLGESGAHLIGYIGEVFAEDIEADPTLRPGDVIGKTGLEATFDERLQGKHGGKITIQDSKKEEKAVLQESAVEDGEDITITIDASLQQQYFDGFDGESGAAVVTEPTSGELLVLTSSPSFEPNLMAHGISDEAYQEYAENEETPFLPRYTARYAPGSTFKAITAGIGLDMGKTTLDETHAISGLEWQKDDSWGSYKVTRVSEQPTEVNLGDALVYSDNIFFAQEVVEMGAETYLNGLKQFPFGENFELPIAMNPTQITNSGSFDTEMLLADTAFGQGELLMSPLHQAVFYSPFANGGDLVFPKLEADAETPQPIQPVTPETAETVRDLLTKVVANPDGSTHAFNAMPMAVGAKTGTAEIQATEAENGNATNGFLWAFDAEKQSFLTIVLMEDQSGSGVVEQFTPVIKQAQQ